MLSRYSLGNLVGKSLSYLLDEKIFVFKYERSHNSR